jgi:octanoyl-[GcvH]:protein N-octanoyltransferase
LARVLSRVYAAMNLPMRHGSVGSLRRNGSGAGVEDVIGTFAEEAKLRYGAIPVPLGEQMLWRARKSRAEHLIPPPF